MVLLLRSFFLLIIFFLLTVNVDSKISGKFLTRQVTSLKSSFNKWQSLFKPNKTVQKQDRVPKGSTEEEQMTSVQIIQSRGYPVEIHSVVTEDGYILEIRRIPHGQGQSVNANIPYGKPVFIQHGLGTSDVDWVLSPSDRNLAFRLADLGYDVWLGNIRGSVNSRKHTTLDPAGAAFWNFTWDEMGKYDIPAKINYILTKTGRTKLSYIGHSMGGAIFFIAMITHPELNDKIEVMMGLAPATNLAHMKSLVRYFAPFVNQIEFVLTLFQARDYPPQNNFPSRFQKSFCLVGNIIRRSVFCRTIDFAYVNYDLPNIDWDLIPNIEAHIPGGTSVRANLQLFQKVNYGETFIPYDYGRDKNIQRYGQPIPPPYDLSKVTAPVYLFYGPHDLIVDPKDVAWLAGKLPNLKELIRVDLDTYNHYDFTWATENNRLLYNPIIVRLPSAL